MDKKIANIAQKLKLGVSTIYQWKKTRPELYEFLLNNSGMNKSEIDTYFGMLDKEEQKMYLHEIKARVIRKTLSEQNKHETFICENQGYFQFNLAKKDAFKKVLEERKDWGVLYDKTVSGRGEQHMSDGKEFLAHFFVYPSISLLWKIEKLSFKEGSSNQPYYRASLYSLMNQFSEELYLFSFSEQIFKEFFLFAADKLDLGEVATFYMNNALRLLEDFNEETAHRFEKLPFSIILEYISVLSTISKDSRYKSKVANFLIAMQKIKESNLHNS